MQSRIASIVSWAGQDKEGSMWFREQGNVHNIYTAPPAWSSQFSSVWACHADLGGTPHHWPSSQIVGELWSWKKSFKVAGAPNLCTFYAWPINHIHNVIQENTYCMYYKHIVQNSHLQIGIEYRICSNFSWKQCSDLQHHFNPFYTDSANPD